MYAHRRLLPIDREVGALIMRLGGEKPRWGYLRIQAEQAGLGITVSTTTVRGQWLSQSGVGWNGGTSSAG